MELKVNPRKPIEQLILEGSPNLKRALARGPEPVLIKQEELEAQYEEIRKRREEALADVKARGLVVPQVKWYGKRSDIIHVKNPFLKIAQDCEKQMLLLAKAIGKRKPVNLTEKVVEQVGTDFLADDSQPSAGVN